MSEAVEMSAEKKALLDKIEAIEGYVSSSAHQQYQAAIDEEIEDATVVALDALPQDLGSLVAHFATLGKLRGLRVLKDKTTDLLKEMREELATLS